jgi:hypothetical protein
MIYTMYYSFAHNNPLLWDAQKAARPTMARYGKKLKSDMLQKFLGTLLRKYTGSNLENAIPDLITQAARKNRPIKSIYEKKKSPRAMPM